MTSNKMADEISRYFGSEAYLGWNPCPDEHTSDAVTSMTFEGPVGYSKDTPTPALLSRPEGVASTEVCPHLGPLVAGSPPYESLAPPTSSATRLGCLSSSFGPVENSEFCLPCAFLIATLFRILYESVIDSPLPRGSWVIRGNYVNIMSADAWLLTLPGHQNAWHWQWETGISLGEWYPTVYAVWMPSMTENANIIIIFLEINHHIMLFTVLVLMRQNSGRNRSRNFASSMAADALAPGIIGHGIEDIK